MTFKFSLTPSGEFVCSVFIAGIAWDELTFRLDELLENRYREEDRLLILNNKVELSVPHLINFLNNLLSGKK